MFSVCSGAFFLGLAGLLDGNDATTFASLIPSLKRQFPKANILNDVKYTNNGHVVTSSGLSSGIDASFEVVAKYHGYGRAQDIANHMEYPWQKRDDYARSQLADNFLLFLKNLIRPFSVSYDHSMGDENTWEKRYELWEGVDQNSFMKFLQEELKKLEDVEIQTTNERYIELEYQHRFLGPANIQIQLVDESTRSYVLMKAQRR